MMWVENVSLLFPGKPLKFSSFLSNKELWSRHCNNTMIKCLMKLSIIYIQDASSELQPSVPHCLDYSQFSFFYPSVFDSLGRFIFSSNSPTFKAFWITTVKKNQSKLRFLADFNGKACFHIHLCCLKKSSICNVNIIYSFLFLEAHLF